MTGSRKTAFVLAGGGSLGAVQVGMLQALVAHGVTADLVVGSSVGAINAAWFATHSTSEGVEELATLWRGIDRRTIFPVSFSTFASILLRRDFLLSSDGLRQLLIRRLSYRRVEDASTPLHIVATNFLSGDAVVISSGDVVDAVLASCAIPAAFPPVRFEGAYLADGALTSNTPVRVAVSKGATRLIVLPTGYACALSEPPRGAISNALHALTLLIARQLVSEIDALSADIEYHIVPTLCPLNGSPYDFSRCGAMIDEARQNTEAWIAAGGLEHTGVPPSLRPHEHGHAGLNH